ncbi:uncharacterized protein MAM_02849 [Metarhizium album ARSEF 1941]|uniref:Uncharacterized protein n=1 Tax=Metarhizium album (strain ARSEF 1941) TaxID=1081103 RepID=A0A0B2WSV4_METAS|nr:uncharacterized protein MAM_02849 [Metarhizium album ARSEF 1941]KHN99151.1 hypothetical protein MAM_02849 [Metarhizium album ARSEF 1941]
MDDQFGQFLVFPLSPSSPAEVDGGSEAVLKRAGIITLEGEEVLLRKDLVSCELVLPTGPESGDIPPGDGTLFLTSQRVLYVPENSTEGSQRHSCFVAAISDLPDPDYFEFMSGKVWKSSCTSGHALLVCFSFTESEGDEFANRFTQVKQGLSQDQEGSREMGWTWSGLGADMPHEGFAAYQGPGANPSWSTTTHYHHEPTAQTFPAVVDLTGPTPWSTTTHYHHGPAAQTFPAVVDQTEPPPGHDEAQA